MDSFTSSSDQWVVTSLSAPCMTGSSHLDVLSIQDMDADPGQEVEDVRGSGLLSQLFEEWAEV